MTVLSRCLTPQTRTANSSGSFHHVRERIAALVGGGAQVEP
jgi:hypothetical protein